jgi:hypothetical protein
VGCRDKYANAVANNAAFNHTADILSNANRKIAIAARKEMQDL